VINSSSLKENLRLGEAVYKDFKKEFPVLRSKTFVQCKIFQYEGSDRFEKIRHKVENLADSNAAGIRDVRWQISGKYFNLSEYIDKLKKVISAKKYANCDEQAQIIQFELLKRHQKSHFISMHVRDAESGRNIKFRMHDFSVFGLKKGAEIDNPKTWGNNAVVVDPWSNRVMPANEAIRYYETKFGFNPEIHKITYSVRNQV